MPLQRALLLHLLLLQLNLLAPLRVEAPLQLLLLQRRERLACLLILSLFGFELQALCLVHALQLGTAIVRPGSCRRDGAQSEAKDYSRGVHPLRFAAGVRQLSCVRGGAFTPARCIQVGGVNAASWPQTLGRT